MSGILNKLGLGGHSDSSASSSSASSTSSSSMSSSSSSSTKSGTMGSTTTNTINRAGYADSTDYASTGPAVTAQTTTTTQTTTAGSTGHTGVNNDGYMTRSEERLLVGKEQVSAGVASLNKYVTTEHVQTSVPITKEHVVIEREPIAPGDNLRGDIKEAHYEVALTEERAVAAKETVAVEKVKLRKEVESGSQNVDADLRKEHIEFGTTNEQGKVLGAAPGTAGYSQTSKTTTGYNNIDPIANPRV